MHWNQYSEELACVGLPPAHRHLNASVVVVISKLLKDIKIVFSGLKSPV